MSDSSEQLRTLMQEMVQDHRLISAVFSGPRSADEIHRRVNVRPVQLQSELHYQFTMSTETQQRHSNLPASATTDELWRLATEVYRHVRLVTETEIWEARFTRRNKCLLQSVSTRKDETADGLRPSEAASDADSARGRTTSGTVSPHNQAKSYLIPDGTPCPFLIRTGVMTSTGRVRASQYHKFRQINRFLEFIRDIVSSLPSEGELRVVDFGCGKSYLTFAVHHLLTTLCGRACRITGLDRRDDVVRTCRQIAQDLQLTGLTFERGEIAGFEPQGEVHLAISLHACDTATDDAICQAVRWNSNVVLAVPCCQKELAGKLTVSAQPALLSHGVVKDRFAALATDSMRAAALNAAGYDARIIEFIDMEHTAKNLLIRAIRRKAPQNSARKLAAYEQLTGLRQSLNVTPLRLETLFEHHGILARTETAPEPRRSIIVATDSSGVTPDAVDSAVQAKDVQTAP